MRIIIISAVAQNNVIGRSNGEMPWHSKEEFQHFRNTTLGFPIIMGRKTFESLGKPLKGRLNIIISGNKNNFDSGGVEVFNSLADALLFCKEKKFEKVFVIGGGQVYSQAITAADEMIISIMNFSAEGDIYFPRINPQVWKVESREKRSEFEILRYVKTENARKN